jgi:hypothetical protein
VRYGFEPGFRRVPDKSPCRSRVDRNGFSWGKPVERRCNAFKTGN